MTTHVSSVELLKPQINDKLNFNLYITNNCRSDANQLNALFRLKRFLGFKEKRILINSYFMANFNYCPLVWMFSSASSLKKIENLQKRALRFLYNDYDISYEELLLKSGRATMNVNRLRILCTEICKIILIPNLWETFLVQEKLADLFENFSIPVHNQVTFGSKSLRVFAHKVKNNLLYHIKSFANLELFKMIIKHWNSIRCNCKVCNTIWDYLSNVNLGLLERPTCTILGWLLIITRCCDVDVPTDADPVSGFCTQILYSFDPLFLELDALTTRFLILS